MSASKPIRAAERSPRIVSAKVGVAMAARVISANPYDGAGMSQNRQYPQIGADSHRERPQPRSGGIGFRTPCAVARATAPLDSRPTKEV